MYYIMWIILAVAAIWFISAYIESYRTTRFVEEVCQEALDNGGSVRIEKVERQ